MKNVDLSIIKHTLRSLPFMLEDATRSIETMKAKLEPISEMEAVYYKELYDILLRGRKYFNQYKTIGGTDGVQSTGHAGLSETGTTESGSSGVPSEGLVREVS